MRVKVKLFANFRIDRFKVSDRDYPGPVTVADIITELCIPEPEVGIIFINGRHAKTDTILTEGDALSLFPLVGGG